MERGLSERYPDKASPIQMHFETLTQLGASPELISPQTNKVTSDTVKVSSWVLFLHEGTAQACSTLYPKKTAAYTILCPPSFADVCLCCSDTQ